MKFCIPKEYNDELKALLAKPTSSGRVADLSKKFTPEQAQEINLAYERALSSKHYENVLDSAHPENALNKFFKGMNKTPEEVAKAKADLHANIERKKGVIDTEEFASILKNAVDSKYKLNISVADASTLMKLNKAVKEAEAIPLNKRGKGVLGEAHFKQEEFLTKLEEPRTTMTLKEELRYNWNETKQGWKDLEGAGFWSKTGYAAGKASIVIRTSAYKSMKATLDASFITIQGNTVLFSSPTVFFRSLKASLKGFTSPKEAMRAFRVSQLDDPDYFNMVEDGLRLPSREEQFMSSMIEKLTLGAGASIKATNNAFTMFLQTARVQEYKRVLAIQEHNIGRKLDRTDANFEELKRVDKFAVPDSQRLKEIASHANKISGTSNLGSAEKYAEAFNYALFAARYTVSGVRMLTDVFRPQSLESRKLAIKTLALNSAGVYGSYWAISAMFPDQTDMRPNSTNFMKIKTSDGTWSPPKGVDQWMITLIAKLYSGEKITAKGEHVEYGSKYGQDSFGGEILHTVRGKLAPLPAVATDFTVGEDYVGREATLGNEAVNLAAPIFLTSLVRNFLSDEDAMTQFKHGLYQGLGGSVR